jgi:hypothetical protein
MHKHTNGLYYKHVTIVNYASSSVNKLEASPNDDTRTIIYNRQMFILQATASENIVEIIAYSYRTNMHCQGNMASHRDQFINIERANMHFQYSMGLP